jgi:hypothetical protein
MHVVKSADTTYGAGGAGGAGARASAAGGCGAGRRSGAGAGRCCGAGRRWRSWMRNFIAPCGEHGCCHASNNNGTHDARNPSWPKGRDPSLSSRSDGRLAVLCARGLAIGHGAMLFRWKSRPRRLSNGAVSLAVAYRSASGFWPRGWFLIRDPRCRRPEVMYAAPRHSCGCRPQGSRGLMLRR